MARTVRRRAFLMRSSLLLGTLPAPPARPTPAACRSESESTFLVVLGRRRDDLLETHICHEVTVVLVAMRIIEGEHSQPRRLTAVEELHGLHPFLVVHARNHFVAVRDGVHQTFREIRL